MRKNHRGDRSPRTLSSIGSLYSSTLLPGNGIKNYNTIISSGSLLGDFQGNIGFGTVSECNDKKASDCLAPYRISFLTSNLDDDDGG